MSKIYLELRSGLGNQLFQFSFGYSLARKFNKELVLCPSYFDSRLKFFVKKLLGKEARNFRLPLLISKPFPVAPPDHWKELLKAGSSVRLFEETRQDIASAPEAFNRDENIYLRGYWQNEKYFTDYKQELVEIIKPTFSLSLRCQNTIIDLNDNVVGIHVRRGDFLTNKSFGACTIDYYLAAIREVRNSIKDPVFLVFTNNASWVKQNFPKDISYQIYSDDNKNSDIEEMFLMSKMKSLIICNSTFSWWSAYLNSPDSLIICPHRWHISEKLETKIPGLISPAWRTIGNTLELSQ